MSAVFFLLMVVVLSGVGCGALYVRQRTPSSLDSGIDSFRREMQALSGARREHGSKSRASDSDSGKD